MDDIDREWLKGYTSETRWLASVKRESGWAVGKGLVKRTLKHWAKAHIFTMGEAQKGMVDALLDSVGC